MTGDETTGAPVTRDARRGAYLLPRPALERAVPELSFFDRDNFSAPRTYRDNFSAEFWPIIEKQSCAFSTVKAALVRAFLVYSVLFRERDNLSVKIHPNFHNKPTPTPSNFI